MVNLMVRLLEKNSEKIEILEAVTIEKALGIVVGGNGNIDKVIFGACPQKEVYVLREIIKRLRGKAIFLGASSDGTLFKEFMNLGISEFTPNDREGLFRWITRKMPGT
jgi:hypothetical protein